MLFTELKTGRENDNLSARQTHHSIWREILDFGTDPNFGLEERSKEEGMDDVPLVQIHRHTVNTVIKWEFGSIVHNCMSIKSLRRALETYIYIPHRIIVIYL